MQTRPATNRSARHAERQRGGEARMDVSAAARWRRRKPKAFSARPPPRARPAVSEPHPRPCRKRRTPAYQTTGPASDALKADRGTPAAGRATNPSSLGRWGPIGSLVAASAVARRARRATARARARRPRATPMEARESDISQTSARGCVAYSLGQRPGRPMQRRRPFHRRRWTSRCSRAARWPLCLRPRAGRRDPRDPARSRQSRGTRIWPAPAPGATRPPSPRRRDCSGWRRSTKSFGAAKARRLVRP